MKIVIQRVTEASVKIENKVIGEIRQGLLLLVAVAKGDQTKDIDYLVEKIINMRIFADQEGKMNLSVLDKNYAILSISQFTLFAETNKGNRPSYTKSAKRDVALDLYNEFNQKIKESGLEIKAGVFAAEMEVSLVNDGPVTIIIDSREK